MGACGTVNSKIGFRLCLGIDLSHEDQRLRIPAEVWNVATPTLEKPRTADFDEFVARPETDTLVRANRVLPPKLRDMPLVALTDDQRPSTLPLYLASQRHY